MNKERILALAEKIEKLPHENNKPGGFTMSEYARISPDGSCKTPACIAGHAVFEFDKTQWEMLCVGDLLRTANIAAELLELDYDTMADELFHPEYINWSSITPAQAAACLRHLAETGEVNWELATSA